MNFDDFREYLEEVDKFGELMKVEGASPELEIGCVSTLNVRRKDYPALLCSSTLATRFDALAYLLRSTGYHSAKIRMTKKGGIVTAS